MKKILVTEFVPDCGLANQMFEWAAGRAIARRLGAEHKWVYKPSTKRRYELDAFGIPLSPDVPPYKLVFDMMGKGNAAMLDLIEKRVRESDAPACGVRAPFQAEECFAEIADEIRCIFRLDPLPLNVPAHHTPVAVQVRRTDYVGHHRLDVTTPEYFRRAMSYMREHVVRPHFFMTSDAPAWCRNTFRHDRDLTILPKQGSITGLRTMAACKAHIISNSTFGWWGAWLAEDGPVVVPEIWHFIQGLYGEWKPAPDRWVRIGGTRPDQKMAHQRLIPFKRLSEPKLDRAIVYPWHAGKAKWDELRYSLRSVDRFFEDKDCPIFILANERPGWLSYNAPRVFYENQWGYAEALIHGVQKADRVLWMNDDIFLLKPTTWEDCAPPRYVGNVDTAALGPADPQSNSWRLGVVQVLQRLLEWGYDDQKVYSTHMPYVWEREKACAVLERFGGVFDKFSMENAYFHIHSEGSCRLGQEFTQGPMLGDAQFLNVTDMLLVPELKEELKALLPEAAAWEAEGVPILD